MDQKATKLWVSAALFSLSESASALTVTPVWRLSDGIMFALCVAIAALVMILYRFYRHKTLSSGELSGDGARLSQLWQHVPDVLTEVDEHGIILKVNRVASGHNISELIGRDGRDFLSEEGKEAFGNALAEIRKSGIPQQYELEITNADGSGTWLSNRIVLVPGGSGARSYLVISSDITEQRKARLLLESARDDAEQASHAKSRFLANMSHEIRTPMTGMLGMASLLEQTALSAEQQECVTTIQHSAEHLLAIINDVLDISKIEANKLQIEQESFDLWELINALLDMTGGKAREKGLNIQSFIDTSVPRCVISDAVRLRQILMNYMTNAIKFTMKGHIILRVVTLQSQNSTARLRFSVEDTGIGMEQDKAAYVFDEFTDAHGKDSALAGGTGLGLNICRRLAEMMGGSVGVVSTPNLGSNFWLDLDIAIASCEVSDLVENPSALPSGQFTAWVLDEVKVNRLLMKEVARRIGFSVHEFNQIKDLQEAFENKDVPDLLVLSRELGPRKIKRLIEEAGNQDKKIFMAMTTVDALNVDYDELIRQGIHAYWEWPIGQEDLRSLLERLFSHDWDKDPGILITRFKRATVAPTLKAEYRGRILLAEDNLVNQKVASQMLRKMGCDVDIAGDGEEALSYWKRNDYDLILMDCHMPVMDGLQAARMIRSQEEGSRTPILALTADVISDRKEDCLQAGMDGFMSKPIRMDELRTALAGYLSH